MSSAEPSETQVFVGAPATVAMAASVSAVFAAVKQGKMTAASLAKAAVEVPDLFSSMDGDGTRILHWLALRGDVAGVEAALAYGAEVSMAP